MGIKGQKCLIVVYRGGECNCNSERGNSEKGMRKHCLVQAARGTGFVCGERLGSSELQSSVVDTVQLGE